MTMNSLPEKLPEPSSSPVNKTGWPWIEEIPPVQPTMPDGSPWPKVSIVTPSFNQARYLEETIRSVLLQGYPNLEYIIVDGGSSDGSLEIIKKYEPWLAHWESQPDRGQSHAINKGWQRSTGEILAWLNSDDLYTAGAISKAVATLHANPMASMVYSDGLVVDSNSNYLRDVISHRFDLATLFTHPNYILQPTVFVRRQVFEQVGWLDENLYMVMDLDLWLRIAIKKQGQIIYLPGTCLAKHREHLAQKMQAQYERIPLEQLQLWDRIYSSEEIPAEIAAVRGQAYSQLYFTYSVHMVQRRQAIDAIRYLMMALSANPIYVAGRPLISLAIFKASIMILWRTLVAKMSLPRCGI